MRLLGPNSLGLLAPWQGLNASFHRCRSIAVNWPLSRSRPPSPILSLTGRNSARWVFLLHRPGDSTDIDVDDLLDFLARDSKTSAILLYLEHLSDARRFVSAARSFAKQTYPGD